MLNVTAAAFAAAFTATSRWCLPVSIIHLLILFVLPAQASSATSATETALPAAVIVENDWPPYYFGGSTNSPPGFARELIEHCGPVAGISPRFEFFPVKRMFSYLEKGEIDIALFSYKPSRERFISYGNEPLFTSGYRPVVLNNSTISITALHDFDSLRLGHLAGLTYSPEYHEYIQKRKAEGTLITTTVGGATLRMLLENIIDVFVDTSDTVLWRAKQLGVSEKLRIIDFDIKTSDYFITLSKNSKRIPNPEEVLELFDSCVRTIKKNGTYEDIARKYGIIK